MVFPFSEPSPEEILGEELDIEEILEEGEDDAEG